MQSHFQILLRGVLGVVRSTFCVLYHFSDQIFEVFWGVHEATPPLPPYRVHLRVLTTLMLQLKTSTVPARYLDLNKINNSSCNYLGSFFIENLNLKKHLINTKTAVLMTDSSKWDGFCWCNSIVLKLISSNGWDWATN